jgi:hypothetical protein
MYVDIVLVRERLRMAVSGRNMLWSDYKIHNNLLHVGRTIKYSSIID